MKPIALVAEAYGANEEKIGAGLVGASGVELLKLLNESGCIKLSSSDWEFINKFWKTGDPNLIDAVWQMHPEVFRTNVFNIHPPGNKVEYFCGPRSEGIPGYPALKSSKYVRKEFIPELERLGDELLEHDPNLVITLGNTPLWALCGTPKIGTLRGATRLSTHIVEGFKVLPTYHPAAIFRQYSLRPITIIDLTKGAREKDYPEIRRPHREIWISPELEDLDKFYEQHIRDAEIIAVDIENPGGPIHEIGFGHAEAAIVVPIWDKRKKNNSYWKTEKEEKLALLWVKKILEDKSIPKVFQNGLYDIAVIMRWWGFKIMNFEHDTMLLHHSLQPESLKGLGFLGSIYTDEGSWKQLRNFKSFKKDD